MRGTTVTLYEQTQTGVDAFGVPIYEEVPVEVEDVLVGEPTTDDITTATALYQKVIRYMLGIPKGDTHNWEDTIVEFWGGRYRTFGMTIRGIEANIPTPWHKKVRVERDG